MKKQSISTGIRIRPLLHDIEKDDQICLSHQNNQILFHSQHRHKKFNFNHILSQTTTQQQTYQTFALPLVEQFFNGFNCTILALGQQKSGKTFTMCGKQSEQTKGIIPRSIDQIFLTVKYFKNTKFLFKVSYFQINNEEIYDLLSVKKCKIEVKQGKDKQIVLNNLQKKSVQKVQDIQSFYLIGNRKKSYAYSKKYRKQSESTNIFTIYLQSLDQNGLVKKSKIHFCQTSATNLKNQDKILQYNKTKLKEFNKINLSKFALLNVLNSLVYGNQYMIPSFNDSKVTKILRDSFGGNTKTTIIANISPSQRSFENSLQVMKILCLFSQVQNNVTSVNDVEVSEIKNIIKQIEEIKHQISLNEEALINFGTVKHISIEKEKMKNQINAYYENQFFHESNIDEHVKQQQNQKSKELKQQIKKLKAKVRQKQCQVIHLNIDKLQVNSSQLQKNQEERTQLLNKIKELNLNQKLIETSYEDRPLKKQLFQMEKQFQIQRDQYLQTIRYLEQKASFYSKIAQTALKKEQIHILKINSRYDQTKRQCSIPMFMVKDKRIHLSGCYNSPKNMPISQRKFLVSPRSSSFNSLNGSNASRTSLLAQKKTNIANRSYKNFNYISRENTRSPLHQIKRKNLKLKLSEAISRKQVQDEYDINRVIQYQKNRSKSRSKNMQGYKLLKKKEVVSPQSKAFFKRNK